MPHGTSQGVLGLGDGSPIGTDGNVADADNTLDALVTLDVGAAEINIADSAGLITATHVEGALAEVFPYIPKYSRLAAASANVNNSVVLVGTGLAVTLQAGTYEWVAAILVNTAAAADVRFRVAGTGTFTAGSSDTILVGGPGAVATVAVLPVKYTAYNTETTHATDGALTDRPFLLQGTVVCTAAGTFLFQFAQGTADVSDTSIRAGSYLVARKVA